MFLVLIFSVVLGSYPTFAYQGGLLEGKPITSHNLDNPNVYAVTDNNQSTGLVLSPSQYIEWTFDIPVDIGKQYWNMYPVGSLRFSFYDDSGTLLGIAQPAYADGFSTYEFQNVKRVRIDNWSTSNTRTIYEADVYLMEPEPTPTPEPEPQPEPTPEPEPFVPPSPNNGGNTLPYYNVLSGNNLTTLWNYLESILTMGMPILLIVVALLLLPILFKMLTGVVKESQRSSRRKRGDDDW